MALTLELVTGSDLTLNRDALTIVRKFRVRGTLPYTGVGDAFDAVATQVMDLVNTTYPMYATPQGTLFWNSIQLHESFYAQLYEISVLYSPFDRQTGTYLVRVEHAAGTAKATAGERIGGYPVTAFNPNELDEALKGNKGVIWNGQEAVGVDVPLNQTRIVIAYRHPQGYLNHAYLRNVGELVGRPNKDNFLGYDSGEIAYAGGNATESACEASAEYSFEVSRNELDFDVGGITIDEKKGFDIISPFYEWDTEDDSSGNTHAIRILKYIEIIRPRGREWVNYVSAFGWGGPVS